MIFGRKDNTLVHIKGLTVVPANLVSAQNIPAWTPKLPLAESPLGRWTSQGLSGVYNRDRRCGRHVALPQQQQLRVGGVV